MTSRIFVTQTGHDPEKGRYIKDPSLDGTPTLGACMPNISRQILPGDFLFAVSGKCPNVQQFIFAAFEIEEKIDHLAAYKRFPGKRLHLTPEGNVDGNIIVDALGAQHPLDHHSNFERRIRNYLVGKNPVILRKPGEIARARVETLDVLREVSGKPDAPSAVRAIGRGGMKLNQTQTAKILRWMESLKIA